MSLRQYHGFTDPSGGSSDSMTLAIAHLSIFGKAVLDGAWERRAPFSPAEVVREFAGILKSYGLHSVTGDCYAGEWPRERFRENEIKYVLADRTKSEFYLDCLVLINSGKARLPRDKRLRAQFETLERRHARSGKDVVDHPPGAHDDLANACAGALCLAAARGGAGEPFLGEILSLRTPYPKDAGGLSSPENDYGFDSPSQHVASFGKPRS